ncbi:3-deoxy-7-phosphoheptulonate synthase [Candidatus Kuenenbacteria bacterium RIFCSPHIGHO2_02_FULL_39_13]|uniref:3-deoxy-7-phosphoheptulonate synthase n=1 Tax=Candidatus Kuenenbacteria bacterium RIFCSPHIGHO2_02_FULL_39_13 TaxID=1798561 RepID=A0A1F6FML6_9BACT|nr:MAG: 3-deoxy-7-phosphoheptulonate synthase [Candidatus Kuenenbacteria bacterium RIFCSPHIGHO2_02_FULL_39_13]
MVISMKEMATETMISAVAERLERNGFQVHKVVGVNRTILGAIGDKRTVDIREFEILDGVHEVIRITEPYKLSSRTFHPEQTVVRVKEASFGDEQITVIAGPCSVESEEQLFTIAKEVKNAGAKVLRGGAFKPRTSPYSFQGLGKEGLKLLKAAGEEFKMATVSEVMENAQIELLVDNVDILQIGARNMQNFSLLREVGKLKKPVLLKRGMAATIEELLMAAEYLMSGGNYQVILCERGIRTFENYTRNTLDISAIPVTKKLSHLPIIADPSHGTGIRDKVAPMARAAVAAGADGLAIEVHHDPDRALSDGAQSLYPNQFSRLMEELRMIAWAIGKKI